MLLGAALLLAGEARAQGAASILPGLPPIGAGPEIRAQLTAREFTTLASETAARIDKLSSRVGERFQKGDVLVVFDCSIQRAQVARARAVLTQAEKTLVNNRRLLALRSVGQLEVDMSEAEVSKAKADLAAADAAASKCTISAPFSGVTVEQKAREFQYATPGQALLEVLDDSHLEVELIAPSRWLSWLKPGQMFQVQVDETGKTYSARVTRLGGRVDPVSQSIRVIGEITNDGKDLMAGMSGRAIIVPPQR